MARSAACVRQAYLGIYTTHEKIQHDYYVVVYQNSEAGQLDEVIAVRALGAWRS